MLFFFFQAEDGIRDLVRSRGLGDVYKRQVLGGYYIYNEKNDIPQKVLGVITVLVGIILLKYLSLIHI